MIIEAKPQIASDGIYNETILGALIKKHKFPDPIFVTRPTMPDLNDYHQKLEELWQSRWLTNNGSFHRQLEAALSEYLDVEHLNLFCNGTIALLVALQALRITSGEVITTPFTFPATVHSLYWNRVRPVFCDISETTYNLEPGRVEELISPETRAILPVHVFGTHCDVEALQAIAHHHGLALIYDAAHAFGVNYKGRSLLEWGDMSILSFHATKLFSTLEGGALICKTATQKARIDSLKNFGIADEETVIGPGINGKMNEFQAAFGLLHLDMLDQEIEKRAAAVQGYREGLKNLPGLRLLPVPSDGSPNHSYFPILVDKEAFGVSRDDLYALLRRFNIFSRKYFYPLCSRYSCYSALPSASPDNLPIAERVASQVLCLPLYGTLDQRSSLKISEIIRELHRAVSR